MGITKNYNFFLVSDSTGETLDRIFLAIKAQFPEIKYKLHHFAFMRTSTQVATLLEKCNLVENPIILYTLVEKQTTNLLLHGCSTKKIPCHGILDHLIPKFETLLKAKATHLPSGQHALDKEYYKKIESLQFTLAHDDGQKIETAASADIIIFGVSRTSKTPTSLYLGERGYKVANIPLVANTKISNEIIGSKALKVALTIDKNRLQDIRKARLNILNEGKATSYSELSNIDQELETAKKIFIANKIPILDVTRKSVEEIAASIIKIYEIQKEKK